MEAENGAMEGVGDDVGCTVQKSQPFFDSGIKFWKFVRTALTCHVAHRQVVRVGESVNVGDAYVCFVPQQVEEEIRFVFSGTDLNLPVCSSREQECRIGLE